MSVLHNMMIADRIVSLGLLAAGLSHHIRNSLVAVKTFLDLAPAKMEEEKMDLEGLRNPDFWKEYYQNVQGQIEKINNYAQGPLDGVGEARVRVRATRCTCTKSSRTRSTRLKEGFAAKQIEVENQIPASLPVLNVDKPKFCRLFELLLKDELASLPAGQPGDPLGRRCSTAPGQQQEIQVAGQRQRPGPAQGGLAVGVRSVCGPQRQPHGIRHSPDGLLFHRASSRRQD